MASTTSNPSEKSRLALLSGYILEKNQQLEKFLLKEQEIQREFIIPFNKPRIESPNLSRLKVFKNLSAKIAEGKETSPTSNLAIVNELVQGIAEIARFSADIKLQQENQQKIILQLQEEMQGSTNKVLKLKEEASINETTQRIRYGMLDGQWNEFSKEFENINSAIKGINKALETIIIRIAELENNVENHTIRNESDIGEETEVIETNGIEQALKGDMAENIESIY